MTAGLTVADVEKMVFVAELRPTSTESLSSKTSIAREEVHACARGGSNGRGNKPSGEFKVATPNFDWLLGQRKFIDDTCGEFVVTVEFNEDLHSWDYRWKSNRWIVDETHVLDITLLTLDDKELSLYNIAASQTSHTFTIFSARHITTNPNSTLGPTPMTYAETTAPSQSETDPFFIKRKDKVKRPPPTNSASVAVAALSDLAQNPKRTKIGNIVEAKVDSVDLSSAQSIRNSDVVVGQNLSAEALLLISCASSVRGTTSL